jgi:hypothetical protein
VSGRRERSRLPQVTRAHRCRWRAACAARARGTARRTGRRGRGQGPGTGRAGTRSRRRHGTSMGGCLRTWVVADWVCDVGALWTGSEHPKGGFLIPKYRLAAPIALTRVLLEGIEAAPRTPGTARDVSSTLQRIVPLCMHMQMLLIHTHHSSPPPTAARHCPLRTAPTHSPLRTAPTHSPQPPAASQPPGAQPHCTLLELLAALLAPCAATN